MNARSLIQAPQALPPQTPIEGDEGIDLLEYWDIIVDNRWLVATITTVAIVIGLGYALLAPPIYESDLLIQVEDSAGSTKNLFGEAASLFDVKTPAAGEMEILRSRLVLGRAVEATKIYIDARPRYVPLVGNWLARRAHGLSDPGFLGFPGYVAGAEKISVERFETPWQMEGSQFRVTALGDGRFALLHPDLPTELIGTVGTPFVASTPSGTISLAISALHAKPGAQFDLSRKPILTAIEALQNSLKIAERGKQSGVIDVSLQSGDPKQLIQILNEIGHQYVRQNVDRKAAEAEKMLAFLDVQIPQFKKQLDQSETAYSRYRNENGTISLDEEAKAVLQQQVDLQSKLMDAKLKRVEMLSRFTPDHPAVKTLDEQIAGWNRQVDRLDARVRTMPAVQENAIRLQRDVLVNNDAYQNLRNNAVQLQLMREGKVGNVRVIDDAVLPQSAVRPKRLLIVELAAALGMLASIAGALFRNAARRGIRSPVELESRTGLSVYSTIPLSAAQTDLGRMTAQKRAGNHLLASVDPQDPAVESLRSLRTTLQFAMLEASNHLVQITGATPGVGKSFISVNFAAILASGSKRVLLIDADMRKGHLNQYFDVSRDRGLSELIAGMIQPADAIRQNVVPNLDLVTTGTLPPNPAELMASGAFATLLKELGGLYDYVVIDTPPLLATAESFSVAAHAGTILLVARADQTQLGEVVECAKRLAHVGRHVTGVLFNGMDLARRHYGTYGYRYGGYKYLQYKYKPSAQ
jgi:tyrosine-protein kinase Etk/Wzc